MDNKRQHAFCWVELATTDSEAAKNFYQGLFNWSYHESPMPKEFGGNYIVSLVDNDPAAAMFAMTKPMIDMGIPPHWGSYVAVSSCDEMAKKACSLGAELLKEPFDVPNAGRMAVLKDPCGAVIHLWEGKQTAGATASGMSHGAFCWHELWVDEPQKAIDFYSKLFGWTVEASPFDGKTYYSLKLANGDSIGGIVQKCEDMANVPAHWAVYFTVNSLENAIAHVKKNGGQVVFGPHPVENFGQFAVCLDNAKASFSIFEFSAHGDQHHHGSGCC